MQTAFQCLNLNIFYRLVLKKITPACKVSRGRSDKEAISNTI